MAKIRNKQPDADAGRVIVDEQLEDLEARLTSMYAQTAKEVQNDLDKFLAKYKKQDAEKQAMVEADEMTKDEYIDWRNRQIFRSNAMRAKIDDVTARMVNTDKQAMSMVNDQLPETYATSYNFGGYRAEAMSHEAGFDYTQFTIINQDAVKELMTKDPDLIPWKADPDVEEDKRWNRQHVQEAVRQGIVKGDSMDDIAKRLLPIVNMDKNAAIRTARTAVNGIENKGRKDATERVKAAGIPMIEMWSCTHDNRTRDTHILLDKTLPNEKGLFGEGILTTLLEYPGDPSGDPAEVYNCRCGLMSTIKGIDHSKDDELYAKMMEEEYYEDWLQVKEKQDEKEAAFQTKKEGAAERVAAKQNAKEESNIVYSVKEGETPKETVERNIVEAGHSVEELKEFRSILDRHTQGGEQQKEADAEIIKHLKSNDEIAQLIKDKAELEAQAWELQIKEKEEKELQKYESNLEYAMDMLKPGGLYANYTEEDLRDWGMMPEKPEFIEPRFYRKGDMDGDVLAFSKNESGAGMSFLTEGEGGYIGYDVSYTLKELQDMGYEPVAGIMSFDVGMSGEAEVLFVKLDQPGEKPAEELLKASEISVRDQKEAPEKFSNILYDRNPELIQAYKEYRVDDIMKETSMDKKEAVKSVEAIDDYFTNYYPKWKNHRETEEDIDNINSLLSRMEPYDGTIYRGLHFDDKEVFNKYANAEVGSEISTDTITSWSSEERVALRYADVSNYGVILVCENNESSVGVQHLSPFGKDEAEVMAQSTTQWEITKKELNGNIMTIYLKEKKDEK